MNKCVDTALHDIRIEVFAELVEPAKDAHFALDEQLSVLSPFKLSESIFFYKFLKPVHHAFPFLHNEL